MTHSEVTSWFDKFSASYDALTNMGHSPARAYFLAVGPAFAELEAAFTKAEVKQPEPVQ